MTFSINFFQFTMDLVAFTEEILNGKFHFLGSAHPGKKLAQGVNLSKVNNKNSRTTLFVLLLTRTYLTPCTSVFVVYFEHVKAD